MAASNYAGVLVVDKEQGPTSHDVVARLRRLLGMRRIGHCGTLDPLATGVLVTCLGAYTRLSAWLSAGEKEYEAALWLGATSATGDAQGPITPRSEVEPPPEAMIAEYLTRFTGEIEQVPPVFSAVKVQGVRSYRLARRNRPVELAPRRVHITRLQILEYAFPLLRLHLVCSAGTYVRSVAMDLGENLGCGAYVQALRRLRVGGLDASLALGLEQVQEAVTNGRLEDCLVSPQQALGHLPKVALGPVQLRAFAHGQPVGLASTGTNQSERAVYDMAGRLWGIGRWEEGSGQLLPAVVLRPAEERDTSRTWEWQFTGVVRHGRARGRTLGFPTANLEVDSWLVRRLPRGVYAARVRRPGEAEHGALVNVGLRPTFAEEGLSIEVFLLDFAGDLYDQTLEVQIVRRLRDEQRFASAEALVVQLNVDVEHARTVLAEDGPATANHQTEV